MTPTPTRISPSTSAILDGLKALMIRVQSGLSCATTVEALRQTDARLAQVIVEATALRLSVRGEIAANTIRRERLLTDEPEITTARQIKRRAS